MIEVGKNSFYQNQKSNYALNKLEVPEFFYITNDYTLGSAIAHNGEQIVN